MNSIDFYKAFEDKYRGSRDLIKSRLSVYLPFIQTLKQNYKDIKALDLGCGRGEWLELLNEQGYTSFGVDLDEGMLLSCKKRDLNVKNQDAIKALQSFSDNSLSVVSGFHIAEHLPFKTLQLLVQEALRVLVSGGLLILETPNSENPRVAMQDFYLDPTHINPIPSNLLSFITQYYGYKRNKLLRLQERQSVKTQEQVTLSNIINDVSPDYAIIAQKDASQTILHSFDDLFTKEYGLSLETLVLKFDHNLVTLQTKITQAQNETNAKITQAQNETNAKITQIQNEVNQANQKALQMQQNYLAITNSYSWKITKPLRFLTKYARWFITGSYHWLTFSPTSRPRRVLQNKLIVIKTYINKRPRLKSKILTVLNYLPKLKKAIQSASFSSHTLHSSDSADLSQQTKKIYQNLHYHIEQKKASK